MCYLLTHTRLLIPTFIPKVSSLFLSSNERVKLEVDPSAKRDVDFGNILRDKTYRKLLQSSKQGCIVSKHTEDFIDDPDVPPLI